MEAQGEGNREEIEDDKLYHVVTDLYTGQMLGAVMDTSYGLLSITPKDKMEIQSKPGRSGNYGRQSGAESMGCHCQVYGVL